MDAKTRIISYRYGFLDYSVDDIRCHVGGNRIHKRVDFVFSAFNCHIDRAVRTILNKAANVKAFRQMVNCPPESDSLYAALVYHIPPNHLQS